MKKKDNWASSWKGSLFGAFLCIAILYFLKTNYRGFLDGRGHSNKDGFGQFLKLIDEFAGGETTVYVFVIIVFLYFIIDAIRKYRKEKNSEHSQE